MWKRAAYTPHNFSFCIPRKKERHKCWVENHQMLLLISLNLSMSKTLGACGLPMRVPTLSWCPPNSRKVVVGQQLWLLPAAPHWHAHLPMVPGAMPSTLTLPRHTGMLSHSWKQEETGLPAYFSHRVLLSLQQLWNETKQWEMSESSPHSSWVLKAVPFLSTMLP